MDRRRWTMTNRDTANIASALARWFESQEISPADSAAAMVLLMGAIIGKKARSEEDMLDGIAAATTAMLNFASRAQDRRGTH
jgi:hypothetical protein